MYIKIIDCALNGKDDEQKFYDIFGDMCDTIAINMQFQFIQAWTMKMY